jgi:hypothetical protein
MLLTFVCLLGFSFPILCFAAPVHELDIFNFAKTTQFHRQVAIDNIKDVCWSAPKVPLTCQHKPRCVRVKCIVPLLDTAVNSDEIEYMPTEISWSDWDTPYRMKANDAQC